MPQIPRDPEHDLDAELRRMIDREYGRLLADTAPLMGDLDDPEV